MLGDDNVDNVPTYKAKAGANYWLVRAGERGRYASDFETGGFVAIGIHPVEDVSSMSRRQMRESIASKHPGTKAKAPVEAALLYRFVNEIQIGDIIVTSDGGTRELLLGQVIGPYEYHATPAVSNFRHVREAAWLGRYSRDYLPQDRLRSLGSPLTLYQLTHANHLVALLKDLLRVGKDSRQG